jgi:hypothetical protein
MQKAFVVWFMLVGVVWAAPQAYPVDQGFNLTLVLRAGSSERVQISLAQGASEVIVRLANRTQRLRVGTVAEDFQPRGSVLIADVNFDGWLDVLTPASTGYGGVNYFFDVYTFNPRASRFEWLELPGGDGPQACNPEPRPRERILLTNCKSGPAYYTTDYRFLTGKPYVYRSSEMFPFGGFKSDDLLFKVRVFDPRGRQMRTLWTDDPAIEQPAVRVVTQARLFLHERPDRASQMRTFIVRGDRVAILDVLETNTLWVKVAYQSRKLGRLVRWVYLGL